MSAPPTVFFYISGHGFGHASRQIETINALARLRPDVRLVIRTSAARWLFERTVNPPFTWLEGPCDTGIVQLDSLRLDEVATIARAAAFYAELPGHTEREANLLRQHEACFVVADAPPLAAAAAAAAGVPCALVSNFTWDWIYEGYSDQLDKAPQLIPTIQAAYAQATDAWRLPMHGGFETTPQPVDLPFIARHASHQREYVRTRLGLPLDRPLAFSSFGGYGVHDLDPARIECRDEYGVVFTGRTPPDHAAPAGVHFVDEQRIYDHGLRYEDIVAAVDVVVTKPGFGIIAECVANDTAMLYTSRGRFREYDVMVSEMPRVLRCGFIAQQALLEGRWREALEAVLRLPSPPERPATDGAEVAARLIAARLP